VIDPDDEDEQDDGVDEDGNEGKSAHFR